jgi:ABC-type dipeptide/oligopeptide/nickel transport system permease component
MTGYVIRRLLLVIPVVWGALTILFILFFIVPGDPVELMAGASGRAVPEATRTAIEEEFGLNDPIIVQYVDFWKRTLTGDLGTSYASRRPVTDILGETFPNSLRLAIWAIMIETVVGISAGVLSAIKRYSFADGLTTVLTALAASIPVFVLGFIAQQMFGVFPNQNDWPEWARLPVQGTPENWNLFLFPSDWRYLVLPMLVLASVGTALVARMTRTTMLEVSRADYMRTARAKGLTERRVVMRHGLRNALIPVVTLIGLDLANLIGAAIITETVFNWRGMGRQIATSIFRRDAPVVLGLTLVLVVAYVLINLLVDLSYGFFDPRVRIGKEKS